MHREQHDVLALCGRGTDAEIERRHPQQRARGEIEGRRASSAARRSASASRICSVERAEIDDGVAISSARRDHLRGRAVAKDEGRAEHLVPPDDLIDGAGEGRVSRSPMTRNARGYVVGGVPGLELIEEPQSLLREGERQAARRARPIGSPATPPRRPRASSCAARPAIVGASNRLRSGSSTLERRAECGKRPAWPAASGRRARRSRRRRRRARARARRRRCGERLLVALRGAT